MSKQTRIKKMQNATERMRNRQTLFVTQKEHLQAIIDLVVKTLFNNSDKSGLRLEEDIFKPYKINLPSKEVEKVWDVLINSGLVSPLMGFGNAGKLELTSDGIKMMTQYGGYNEYLEQQKQINNRFNIAPAETAPSKDAEPDHEADTNENEKEAGSPNNNSISEDQP